MTPNSAPTLPIPLPTIVLASLLRTMLDALPIPPGTTAAQIAGLRQDATDSVLSMQPGTPLQAMLASRFIAAHYAIMECLRRSTLPDLPHPLTVRYQANAMRLSRMMDVTLDELHALQFNARVQAKAAAEKAGTAPQAASRPAQPQPQPQPQAAPRAPFERQYPMPSEPPAKPARSAVELPPAPLHPDDVWIAETVARRRAAAGDSAKTLAA